MMMMMLMMMMMRILVMAMMMMIFFLPPNGTQTRPAPGGDDEYDVYSKNVFFIGLKKLKLH